MAFSPTASTTAGNTGAGWQDRALDRTLADARARDVERMERCVEAARQLAGESGSAAFTVAQIAARADLSLKSFYRCFPGKDELLLALLEDDSQKGARMLAERIDAHEDPLAALRTCVTALFAMSALPEHVGYSSVLVREHRRLSEHYPLELRVALAPLVELLAERIAAVTNTPDPRRDAETMFRVILQGIDDVVCGRTSDPHEHAGYVWNFCWGGLRQWQ
jgi:AcrR family transcriptional regulator